VTGPAGSGKTVLAVETARNMAEKKKKILFLCYNQNLSRYLSNLFSEEPLIEVHSLFGLFTSIDINLKDLGTANLSPKQAAPLIANTLNENFDKFNTEFDVLIIDEAQDFSPLFWPIFELMTENKKWFLFSDKRQAITHDDWQLPDLENNSWLTYPLTKYLRSTREISDKVLKVYKDSYEALAINGLEPEYLETKDSGWTESLEVLTKVLTGLIEVEKYHPWQIQILIPHSRYLEDVEQAKYKANQKIGGIKDLNIESIYKYKGLESEVVILLIPNLESLESENTSDIKSLIYVGMSRATSFLIVIGDKEIKKLSNWDS
jgi:DNA helicase IV